MAQWPPLRMLMWVKNNTHLYVERTSNNRVIMACDLYRCLLPQCEALHTCCSGFPITTKIDTALLLVRFIDVIQFQIFRSIYFSHDHIVIYLFRIKKFRIFRITIKSLQHFFSKLRFSFINNNVSNILSFILVLNFIFVKVAVKKIVLSTAFEKGDTISKTVHTLQPD